MTVDQMGMQAKDASRILGSLDTNDKNRLLTEVAQALIAHTDQILEANALDLQKAQDNHMSQPLQDRLRLSAPRIEGIAQGILEVAALPDPIGSILEMNKRPNGLLIGRQRVPLGVVAVIYESRPNVTADVFALCFKTGNAVILKGGKDAFESNKALVEIIRNILSKQNLPMDAVQLMMDNSREASLELMKCSRWVDVLIPRGGAGLIRSCVENATVPVIETGTGNCHVYVDESADLEMAARIIINGKTQRTGVCNATESLLVHEAVAEKLIPVLSRQLAEHDVLIHAEKSLMNLVEDAEVVEAVEEDWGREYLASEISMKTVSSVEEAIEHINRYNTGHSESIVTSDYFHAQKFLNEVDAAAVYVNASTRFTDGHEFGLGAEIGISTQKLHARGPMGLEALTSTKYIIYGDGQIRP